MRYLYSLFLLLVLSFFSCHEVPPLGIVDPPPPPPPSKRNVLIEEFTGVGCKSCPNGSAGIRDLISIHGSQVIAISIHSSGNFSVPSPQNQYDFRTAEGDAIKDYLGGPIGFPSAVVNRKAFDGRTSLQMKPDEWAGYVAEEKMIEPKVALSIQSEFDATSRNASIDVAIFVKETITEPNVNLSLMFTEDDIIDYQMTDNGPDPSYNHEHVFRGMATPYDGSPLTEDLTVGREVSQSFNYSIPSEWKEDKVNVIAVVSLAGEKKDVLQVHKIHLID